MLAPVLEIYVIWHPDDPSGKVVADELVRHFHGTVFTGLIGGAIEIYVRAQGWRHRGDAPRPIPFPTAPPPNGLSQALLTAVVPVVGIEFAAAVEETMGPWHRYLNGIISACDASPDRVAIFPLVTEAAAIYGTAISRMLQRFHGVGRGLNLFAEPAAERRCRDLSQGIAQFLGGVSGIDGPRNRLTVFISHTSKPGHGEHSLVTDLIQRVRSIIGQTRLDDFFSTNDLQVGRDWDEELRTNAATSALLALRTDLYASRHWCQREMLTAKRAGMPIVILDALGQGEERGSFLMDHVPRVPIRRDGDGWRDEDIRRGLNLLVDECLKRVLWRHQRLLAAGLAELDVAWWAPHAPEPATLVAWLAQERGAGRLTRGRRVRIIHPDPPLGPDERLVLDQIAEFGGVDGPLDILTPRSMAARGG
jgi:hypothetical protein